MVNRWRKATVLVLKTNRVNPLPQASLFNTGGEVIVSVRKTDTDDRPKYRILVVSRESEITVEHDPATINRQCSA
jgi:hypothetical protein